MGSACCVARKNEHMSSRTTGEILHRNAIYSPSWSFRWDNRRRVAGEIENISYGLSPGFSGDSSMENKGSLERGSYSSGRSPLRNFRITMSPRSPIHEGQEGNLEASLDITSTIHGNIEDKSFKESVGVVVDSEQNFLINTTPSGSSSCPQMSDPTTSQNSSSMTLVLNSTHPRKASRSPGHQLSRQISDSRILGRKSPISEGRPSFVLSACNSSDLVGGSSDGWSMRTFSELVASSRRERWSFDSEFRVSESSSTCSRSPSTDVRNCGICWKHLNEKSMWSSQKIVANNSDLSIVAVLGCGHVYHAECLEAMTQEGDECDPMCPICVYGSKQLVKMMKKIAMAEAEMRSRRNKKSKRRVRDSYDQGYDVLDTRKTVEEGKLFCSKMETSGPSSSTGGRRSFSRPFLRRHFSFGSKWNRPISLESSNNSGRKSFWSRFH